MDVEDSKTCRFIVGINMEFKILIIILTFCIQYNNHEMGDIVQVP